MLNAKILLSPRGKISLFDSIGFLCLYLIYLVVVVLGRFVNQHMVSNLNLAKAYRESIPIIYC